MEGGTRRDTGQSVGKDVDGYEMSRFIERGARAMGDSGENDSG